MQISTAPTSVLIGRFIDLSPTQNIELLFAADQVTCRPQWANLKPSWIFSVCLPWQGD
jgi:hypothetical protein